MVRGGVIRVVGGGKVGGLGHIKDQKSGRRKVSRTFEGSFLGFGSLKFLEGHWGWDGELTSVKTTEGFKGKTNSLGNQMDGREKLSRLGGWAVERHTNWRGWLYRDEKMRKKGESPWNGK